MRTLRTRTLRLTKSRPLIRYGFAFVAAIAGLIIEYAFHPQHMDFNYVLMYPICFIVIAVAGFGPACLAIFVNTIGMLFFLVEPFQSFRVYESFSIVKTGIFAVTSLLIASLIEYNHIAEKKLVQDLAELEGIEKVNERLQLAINATGIGIWEHSGAEELLHWSDELRNILNLEESVEPSRLNWMNQIHPEDRPELILKINRATDPKLREDYHAQVRTTQIRNGRPQWISMHGRPYFLADGRVKRFVGTVKDISETKNFQDALEKAKEEAESANALKSAFLANMSHEIRTPLGAILGFINLLKENDFTESKRAEYLEIASHNGDQLERILNDILDISKVESGHMKCDYQWVDVRQVVAQLISLMSVKAAKKGIELRSKIDSTLPTYIATDAIRLKQILSNIVGNAIKFTNSGWIQITVNNLAYRKVGFEISDTGMGVADAQQTSIFETFVQADASMSRRYEGTGLGLPLSRKIAQILGGSVSLVQSKLGEGSHFSVVIENREQLLVGQPYPSVPSPRNKDASNSSSTPAEPIAVVLPKPLAGVKILLVEDSKDNQQLICQYLAKSGAVVEIANDGQEGFSAALRGNSDLVLMDIQMPIMDGYTATEKLRDEGFRKPIIALTAHAMAEFRQRSRKAGCTDHLAKPIDRQLLIQTIEKHLQREA